MVEIRTPPKISIVMPVLNEAKYLRDTLNHLILSDNEELIIVDGGSTDETMSVAGEFTEKVFRTVTGRASTMNFGARKAAGEILLFLHADCVLPYNAFHIIRNTVMKNNIAAGAFYLNINATGFRYRLIEAGANIRSRATGLLYGDQGIFLKKATFHHIGGYPDIPLMEDIEISRILKKTGRLVQVKPPIKTSPRRWIAEGALYTTLRDWSIAFSYTFLKVSPYKLLGFYKDAR